VSSDQHGQTWPSCGLPTTQCQTLVAILTVQTGDLTHKHLMVKRLGMPLPRTTNAQTNVCTNGWTMQKHNVSSHLLDKWRHKNRITWPVNIQFQTLQTILLHQTVPNKLSALFLCQLNSMPLNKQTNTRLTALFPGQPR